MIIEEINNINAKVNTADNDVTSAMIKLRAVLENISPEIADEFRIIRKEYEQKINKLYEKYDL